MKLLDLAVGKKMKVMTDARVEVELEIKKIEPKNHSRDLEPSTAANDWWPAQETWSTYVVHFTNGFTKEYSSINSIDFY